jgi:NADH-quinone oxidoreductase subunit I
MPYQLENQPANVRESLYFPEIFRAIGLVVTTFWRNAFFSRDPNPDILERDRTRNRVSTLQYPEEKAPYPPGYRGLHRLVPRPDGSPRCVACFMCATACPAVCIHIEAEPRLDSTTEKMPRVFQIDELRCVDCGLCVEACPCDAIRMDSNKHPFPSTNREDQLQGRWDLLAVMGIHDDGQVPKSARTMNDHVPGKDPGPKHH